MLNQTTYSKRLLFGHAGVFLCAPFPGLWQIRIHPQRLGDAALHAHEREHLRQYRAEPWAFAWRMVFDKRYRHRREREGYAVELSHTPQHLYDDRLTEFVAILADQYGGNRSEDRGYLMEHTQ